MKKCPYCAEEIQDEAIYCRWCERYLEIPRVVRDETKSNVQSGASSEGNSRLTEEGGLKRLLFSSKGRLSRKRYTSAIFGVYFVGGIAAGITYALFTDFFDSGTPSSLLLIIGYIAFWLFTMEILIIKRFHDLDKDGMHSILAWIPPINIVVGWILFLKKGTDGDNAYGIKPRD